MMLAQARFSLARLLSSGITSFQKCRRVLLPTLFCALIFVVITPAVGALWIAVGILPIEMLYSTGPLLRWYLQLLCIFLVAAATVGVICLHVASRTLSIALGFLMALIVFLAADFYSIYATPYSPAPSAGLYTLYAIGYAAGAVLLASVARICVELQGADWQPRTLLLCIGFGSITFLAALYALWLLPLPTHVALTAEEWRNATIALRPDRLSRASGRWIALPGEYKDSIPLDIGAKSVHMFTPFLPAEAESVRVRTGQPQFALICWPYWLHMEATYGRILKMDGKTCLKEDLSNGITIRGDIMGMRADLNRAGRGATETVFVPLSSNVSLSQGSQSEGRQLKMETVAGVTIITEAHKIDTIEVIVDRFNSRRILELGVEDFREEIVRYKAGIAIEIGSRRYEMKDNEGPMQANPSGEEAKVVLRMLGDREEKDKNRLSMGGSLPASLEVDNLQGLYLGRGVSTFSARGVEGEMKNGGEVIQVERLDKMFLAGPDLHMKLKKEGGFDVYGEATHVVVNGRVMWRAIGQFMPSEVWAAIIGAAVSWVFSVALLRRRGLMGHAEH